ncbi:DUF6247 family protein [Actinomycetospora sp.]|jgi:hypothetical protein|uniref:DUF6247 family protein n=1 Tax=Actinomycetospora sp. TaxID=1872135 RepID=UPI002F3E4402
MTAAEHVEEGPTSEHPLLIGTSPKTITDHLFPEDRTRFNADYESALDDARRTYDLTGVHQVVEHWRQVAVLQSDPASFRESVRAVAEIVTGVPTPQGESFEVTRQKAGM